MTWPWRFNFDLAPEELDQRRYLLDSYGQLAQYSVLLPLLLLQITFALRYFIRIAESLTAPEDKADDRAENAQPASWALHYLTKLRKLGKIVAWVSDAEVLPGWGTWRHVAFGLVWGLWLAVLVVRGTGDDYMHLTKRFGIVAASQLPLHYLLSAKPRYNPIQYLTRLSHEELNPYHRVFGYVLITFFAAHATLYLNFYVQISYLAKRIKDSDVQLGLAAITSFILIATTAISYIRHYSYRLFYSVHILLSFAILPMLYFHVSHLRIYILEAGAVYVFLVLQRYFPSNRAPTTAILTLIPTTNLLKISLPLPPNTKPGSYSPGQHIYLSRPFPSDTPPHNLSLSHMNPFSIASNPLHDPSARLELIARSLNGSTALIAAAALKSQAHAVPFILEGPYGSAAKFPSLLRYDRILLVAGGVGATFTIPIYLSLLRCLDHPSSQPKHPTQPPPLDREKSIDRTPRRRTTPPSTSENSDAARASNVPAPAKIRFVWSVRSRAEAAWGTAAIRQQQGRLPASFGLFVTGAPDGRGADTGERRGGKPFATEKDAADDGAAVRGGRPDLRAEARGVFGPEGEGSVAVLVCGPAAMGRELRREVGGRVWEGREVFWHEERFSW